MTLKRVVRKKIIKKTIQKEPPTPVVAAYPILIHKLREMSFQIRGGDNWIRSISDKHLLELYDLIIKDKHTDVILEHARSSWNYPVSMTQRADVASIKLFKSKALHSSIHGLNPITDDEKTIRKQFMTRARTLLNQFDPIAELVAICQEQKRRVQMGLDNEIVDDKINPSVSAELSTLNRMTHELIEKFQRLGLIEEKPLEQILQVNGTFNSVISMISKTNSADKMIGIANDFLSQLEDSVVEMEAKEDGTFEVIDK